MDKNFNVSNMIMLHPVWMYVQFSLYRTLRKVILAFSNDALPTPMKKCSGAFTINVTNFRYNVMKFRFPYPRVVRKIVRSNSRISTKKCCKNDIKYAKKDPQDSTKF